MDSNRRAKLFLDRVDADLVADQDRRRPDYRPRRYRLRRPHHRGSRRTTQFQRGPGLAPITDPDRSPIIKARPRPAPWRRWRPLLSATAAAAIGTAGN